MLTYLRAAPWVAILILLALLARMNDLRSRYHHLWEAERAGRLADRSAYESAQREAATKNEQQLIRIKSQQQAITDETVSNLNSRLELIRGELRKASPAPQGATGSPEAGGAGEAPCRVTNAAWLCVAPEDRLRAAESEERHDSLIDWVTRQSSVDPNAH